MSPRDVATCYQIAEYYDNWDEVETSWGAYWSYYEMEMHFYSYFEEYPCYWLGDITDFDSCMDNQRWYEFNNGYGWSAYEDPYYENGETDCREWYEVTDYESCMVKAWMLYRPYNYTYEDYNYIYQYEDTYITCWQLQENRSLSNCQDFAEDYWYMDGEDYYDEYRFFKYFTTHFDSYWQYIDCMDYYLYDCDSDDWDCYDYCRDRANNDEWYEIGWGYWFDYTPFNMHTKEFVDCTQFTTFDYEDCMDQAYYRYSDGDQTYKYGIRHIAYGHFSYHDYWSDSSEWYEFYTDCFEYTAKDYAACITRAEDQNNYKYFARMRQPSAGIDRYENYDLWDNNDGYYYVDCWHYVEVHDAEACLDRAYGDWYRGYQWWTFVDRSYWTDIECFDYYTGTEEEMYDYCLERSQKYLRQYD